MSDKYEDIINLPHHVSKRHRQMPLAERAAQFAPFAALEGHAAVVRSTAQRVRLQMEEAGEAAGRLGLLKAVIQKRSCGT